MSASSLFMSSLIKKKVLATKTLKPPSWWSKLKLKLGFFFRIRSCFSLQVRSHLIMTTFLPLPDYGDLHALDQYLTKLDTVYNSALRFVTRCGNQVHRCTLYATANCPSLATRRSSRWLSLLHKAMIGLVPVCPSISRYPSASSHEAYRSR